MTRIAITGASGRVGRAVLDAFPDDDLTLYSHSEAEDLDTTPLEITDREAFVEALEGQDVLIHLAANPSPTADWDDLSDPNVDGVYNAFEAAVRNDLERVVYASSNHAVNMDNVVSPTRPETTQGRPTIVRPDDPPAPDTYYGITKVLGEAMGYYYAAHAGLDVVSLRIGWLLGRDELREECDELDGPGERFARAMWVSPEDCRRVVSAAVNASLTESPVTAHGISRNTERFLSLAETQTALGYRPRDDSAAVLDGDGGSGGERDGLQTG